MAHIDFEGVKLDVCRKHKGMWFDHGELMILYAIYLKETDGESFLKEDTKRFFLSLFMRREPLVASKEGRTGFLVGLNLLLAPLSVIDWIWTAHAISELNNDEDKVDEG